ncbi:MAG TPA: anhydro-N-acetylmuramic acid kinase [Burkholderiales bacterium]|nr:anhydro-N-acetylmuramic acid kinase [Burkholderiales bacterium]
MNPPLCIGLMSGTSLDGVDAALADFSGAAPRTLATHFAPFDSDLRAELLALQSPAENELERAALAANRLMRAYAAAVTVVLDQAGFEPESISALGAHGQTVRHRPELGYTLQLNNPALLAELTGIPVVADFRARDVAAGGQGAPLVPAFHRAAFGAPGQSRVIVNIGGIGNITVLQADDSVLGFDTGPGNVLMDLWINRHHGKAHDAAGAWAASGKVQAALLTQMLAEPYFALPSPKSTGRDLFNAGWLARHDSDHPAADVQATLCELTASTIVAAIRGQLNGHAQDTLDVFVCGGGVHNATLQLRLAALAPQWRWQSTAALGVAPDWVEAMAFAWLAHQTLAGAPGNLASVTGAAGARVLGAVYPR